VIEYHQSAAIRRGRSRRKVLIGATNRSHQAKPRRGKPRPGKASQGEAWQAKARPGAPWQGMARLGAAWHGKAWWAALWWSGPVAVAEEAKLHRSSELPPRAMGHAVDSSNPHPPVFLQIHHQLSNAGTRG
jgi:hypothetical protein